MKYLIFVLIALLMSSCIKEDIIVDEDEGNETIFKQRMREFVVGMSQYSKAVNPNFLVVPQNGVELLSNNGALSGKPHSAYLNAIDASGQENLFYGYQNDDQETSATNNSYLKEFLNISKKSGNTILITDYCSTPSKMTNSYLENSNLGYVSFAADQRDLDTIPTFPSPIYQESNTEITNLSQVKNFLYILNLRNFSSKSEFISAITSTNYDLLIMDLFFNDGTIFTSAEISQLRNKANGGKRLIFSYMSIGEAEDYRYYWQSDWDTNKPNWLDAENPNWAGNFKVKYWDPEWQNIIYGNDNSYLAMILNANFDGVYLDLIDSFKFYEN